MKKIITLILLSVLMGLQSFGQLHIEKRKHLKGFHIELRGSSPKVNSITISDGRRQTNSSQIAVFKEEPVVIHRVTESPVAASSPEINATSDKKVPLAIQFIKPKINQLKKKLIPYVPAGAGLKKRVLTPDEEDPIEIDPRNNIVAILTFLFGVFSLGGLFLAVFSPGILMFLTLLCIPALLLGKAGKLSQFRSLAFIGYGCALAVAILASLGLAFWLGFSRFWR